MVNILVSPFKGGFEQEAPVKIPRWIQVVAFLFSMAFLFGCGMAGSSGSGNSNASGLTITTATLPDATIDQSYSGSLQASGGTAPYSWSVSSGSLPTGLSLTTAGQITGTPTKMGSYSFQVQVVDKTQRSSSGHVAVKVTGPTPSISGISPAYGATAGGTMVTINGKNLQSGATVTFDGLAGTSVNVTNSNQMTTVTPAHAAGSVDVVVTNPGGKSATLFAGFGYGSASPSVSATSPNTGPTTGGTTVKITGSNFVAGALVFFGTVAATGINVSSPTQIQAITPSVSTAAAVNVEVQNSDGQSGSLTNGFTYTDSPSNSSPSVSDVSPNTTSAGTDVTVNGTNFASGATVNIGSTAASNVQFLSSTQLTATVPSVSPGTYDVTVANTNGLSATLSPGLTVADPVSGDLLSGCTVSSSNQPVCGTDAGTAAIPSGWTLVDAQGFESGSFNSGESAYGGTNSETISTANNHTGTHSLDSYITHSYGGLGMVLAGASIASRTVYVSWWQYVQQANPGYGVSYTDWYMAVRGKPNGVWINSDWEVPNGYNGDNCLAACNPAQVSFYAGGTGAGDPNFGLYMNYASYPLGSWVQYEVYIKANDPGSDNGEFKLYQNGVLLESVSNANDGNTRCPDVGGVYECGNFVGNEDMTNQQLWIGGDWGADYVTTLGGSPQNQDMSACSGGYFATGQAGTADQLCPPSGTIPYFHIYIDDVIVMKQ